MLTTDDLINLKEFFVTKDELRQLEERLSDKMTENTNKLMDRLDLIIGELKTIRQEQAIQSNRLDEIESVPAIAHDLKR